MSISDQGGTAVITGAGSGIGLGLARRLAERGFDIVVADLDEARANEAAQDIEARGVHAVPVRVDVSSYEDVLRLADVSYDSFGSVDMLVNNAGIEATGYLWETDPATWRKVIDVNVMGVYHGLRAFLPRMMAQEGRSTIVNVASLAALASGPAQQSAYNASKHAVLAATECLRLELTEVRAPIDLHVVLPGPVSTKIFEDALATTGTADTCREQLHRFVTDEGLSPDEAAAAILAGIDAKAFWISTHESMHASFAERRAELLTRRLTSTAVPIGV